MSHIKNKRGRQPLSEIEKMRRSALRQKLLVDELKEELDRLGDNIEEIEAMDAPGRRPKPRSERLSIAKKQLSQMKKDIKEYEAVNGIEPVTLSKVKDPLLENGTLKAVGKKPKDAFSVLDQKILLARRAFADLIDEWKVAGSDVPPPVRLTEKTGKPYGRAPKSFPFRVLELQKELAELMIELEKLEKGLTSKDLMQRQLDLLRNQARELRFAYKKTADKSAQVKIESQLRDVEIEVNQISARIKREEDREALGFVADKKAGVVTKYYSSDLQKMLDDAERRLLKSNIFRLAVSEDNSELPGAGVLSAKGFALKKKQLVLLKKKEEAIRLKEKADSQAKLF